MLCILHIHTYTHTYIHTQEEVDFKDNMELKCYVSELLTGEEIFATPIKINVRSVFSKFRVLPQKGISFGALMYDTQKSRTFDIVNQVYSTYLLRYIYACIHAFYVTRAREVENVRCRQLVT